MPLKKIEHIAIVFAGIFFFWSAIGLYLEFFSTGHPYGTLGVIGSFVGLFFSAYVIYKIWYY